MSINWRSMYAERTKRIHGSDIRALLKITSMKDMISLAGGNPAPEAFPIPEFREAYDQVIDHQGKVAFQYGLTEGYGPLREFLAERVQRTGIRCASNNILITAGSQQGLDLIGKVFINPGDKVLVEKPSYSGALQAFDAYQARYVTVPMDEEGMVTWDLDRILRREKVKFIYALPNFQNPTGRTMSLSRRKELIAIATRHRVPIVEDDPYGELRYEGQHLPSLKSMDDGDIVINLGSFSKILAPGLRLAWMVLPTKLFDMVLFAKQPTDLAVSTITQMAVYELCKTGFADRHVEHIRDLYRERRDAMLRSLELYFPSSVRWTRAEGGLFIWADLPRWMNARELLVATVLKKVAFVPGQSFHVDGSGKNTMRLNFSNVTPDKIDLGVQRIGEVIHNWNVLQAGAYGLVLRLGVTKIQDMLMKKPATVAAARSN
jgi:2-aminoadipate transaminase